MREKYAQKRKNDQKHIAKKSQIIKDVYGDDEMYDALTRGGKQKNRLSKAKVHNSDSMEKSAVEYSHNDKKKLLTATDEYDQ